MQAAVAQFQASIKPPGKLHIVGYDNQARPFLDVEFQQQIEDPLTGWPIEVTGRLVGKNDGWTSRKRTRNGGPLTLAAR